ncbi:MAG: hypothetical protein WC607_00710 [Candidatus Micrarchaeia archaeon]
MKRAQASLETLIVLAALFAAFLAFAPVLARASALVSFSTATTRHSRVFDAIWSAARDASVLGDGNSFSFRVTPPTPANISIEGGVLNYSFSAAGESKSFARNAGFPLLLANESIPEGALVFRVSNKAGVVSVSVVQG